MLHKTEGIVLKTIKYGETSVVVKIYTEKFGIQSYLVNGVRSSSKKNNKANKFQSGSLLNLVVYHNEKKSLQRISQAEWLCIYQHIYDNVAKNCIALFMCELIYKSIKQPEPNESLFDFLKENFLALDAANTKTTANLPIYFSLNLCNFFGFKILCNSKVSNDEYIDLENGLFVNEFPQHGNCSTTEQAQIVYQFLQLNPSNIETIVLNKNKRLNLLMLLEKYYQLHIPEFGQLQTLKILPTILS